MIAYHKRFGECKITEESNHSVSIITQDGVNRKLIKEYGFLYKDPEYTILRQDNNLHCMSSNINNDKEQPQRAVSNYLIRESQSTNFTQKEFYQMVIDSAQHELNLL